MSKKKYYRYTREIHPCTDYLTNRDECLKDKVDKSTDIEDWPIGRYAFRAMSKADKQVVGTLLFLQFDIHNESSHLVSDKWHPLGNGRVRQHRDTDQLMRHNPFPINNLK